VAGDPGRQVTQIRHGRLEDSMMQALGCRAVYPRGTPGAGHAITADNEDALRPEPTAGLIGMFFAISGQVTAS
jgi:hypothetical protein